MLSVGTKVFIFCISFSDLDQEEHLIVTVPVQDQGDFLDRRMGQDEPAVPMGGPLEINIQVEQCENLQDGFGSVPVPESWAIKETPECKSVFPESSLAPTDSVLSPTAAPAFTLAPAPASHSSPEPPPSSCSAPAPALDTVTIPAASQASTPATTTAPAPPLSPAQASFATHGSVTPPAPAPTPAPVTAPTPTIVPIAASVSEPHVDPPHGIDSAPAPAPNKKQDTLRPSDLEPRQCLEVPGESPVVVPEPDCNDSPKQPEPTRKTKIDVSKPSSLKMKAPPPEIESTNEEQEFPAPKAMYNFDPDSMDFSFNPFISGGSKIPNSPPPCGSNDSPRLEPLGCSTPAYEQSTTHVGEVTEPISETKPVMLEFGLDDGMASKPPPRKLGTKKTISKLGARKQKPKGLVPPSKPAPKSTGSEPASQTVTEPVSKTMSEPTSAHLPETVVPLSESSAPLNLDDIPIPKAGSYNFDPNQWEDPDFNPFGSNNKMSSSPVLPKGPYSSDPENSDDSANPFKPTNSLNTEGATGVAAPAENKVKDIGKQKVRSLSDEKIPKQIPKTAKDRTME